MDDLSAESSLHKQPQRHGCQLPASRTRLSAESPLHQVPQLLPILRIVMTNEFAIRTSPIRAEESQRTFRGRSCLDTFIKSSASNCVVSFNADIQLKFSRPSNQAEHFIRRSNSARDGQPPLIHNRSDRIDRSVSFATVKDGGVAPVASRRRQVETEASDSRAASRRRNASGRSRCFVR